MAIVIPRARSSGALSIESNERSSASPFIASTLVIAAVRVVFPWSTCPIVPTFTCGFVRSNLALPPDTASCVFHAWYVSFGSRGRVARPFRHDCRVRGIPHGKQTLPPRAAHGILHASGARRKVLGREFGASACSAAWAGEESLTPQSPSRHGKGES